MSRGAFTQLMLLVPQLKAWRLALSTSAYDLRTSNILVARLLVVSENELDESRCVKTKSNF